MTTVTHRQALGGAALKMVIDTDGVASSVADDDYDGMAYIYCVDRSGYCLSLSRCPDNTLIEVMVVDQRVHRTAEVTASLSPNKLAVTLTKAAAASLDNVTEYEGPISMSQNELSELDAALTAIFSTTGRYERRE